MKKWATDESFFGGVWLNRTFFGIALAEGAKHTIEYADQFGTSAWNGDPNTFQTAGQNAGSLIGEAAGAIGLGIWAIEAHRAVSAPRAFKNATGSVFKELHGGKGGVFHSGTAAADLDSKGMAALKKMKGTEEGYIGRKILSRSWGKKFIKNASFKAGLVSAGIYMGIPLAVDIIGSAALGFAGKYLDQSNNDAKSRKAMYYDNRYFDTRKYDASSYDQIGMAMNDYSNTMQSMARVYHAR